MLQVVDEARIKANDKAFNHQIVKSLHLKSCYIYNTFHVSSQRREINETWSHLATNREKRPKMVATWCSSV